MDSGGAFKCMKLLVKKHRFDALPKTGFPRIRPAIGEYGSRFGEIRNWRAAWTRTAGVLKVALKTKGEK